MLVVRIEHADEERDVGGVAGFDDPVENDAALATGEGDLVTIVRVAAVLADEPSGESENVFFPVPLELRRGRA